MPFLRGGARKRRDASEPEIMQALQAVGAQTWQIAGRGLPDLLVLHRGRFYAAEVKSAKGKLTEAQRDVPWPVIRTPADAWALIACVPRASEEP